MLRKFLSTFLFAAVLPISAQQEISLDDSWQFAADNSADYSQGIAADKAMTVSVPHTWNVQRGLEEYMGRGWYERRLDIPSKIKGKQVRLVFDAVYHDATVFINGQLVGSHIGAGYTPFSFDISRWLRYGEKNRLVVCADNRFSKAMIPYDRHFDWTADGGIYRSVRLHVCGPKSLRYVHIVPRLSLADSTGTAQLLFRLHEKAVRKARFRITLSAPDGSNIITETRMLKRDNDGRFALTFQMGKVTPWHFDTPALYTYRVDVMDGKVVSDSQQGHFGFRRVETRGEQLLLNGEPVRLPGIEYMAGSNPRLGSAEPRAYIDSVVDHMKALNIVITRFHWPQDEAMLDEMDRRGILVQAEIPWWQQPDTPNDTVMASARRNLEEMVETEFNHPCIFAWALSNEVGGNKRALPSLADLAHRLDSSRMVNDVTNHLDRDLADSKVLSYDLPTWNEYVGTWNGSDRADLPNRLGKIRPALAGRPLLITEVGLCEPSFSGGDARRTDDMIYHLGEYARRPWICGYIYFCLNDYRTQMGEEGYGAYRLRRHGVMTASLQPKPSFYQLRAMASPIEITGVKTTANDTETAEQMRLGEATGNYTQQARSIIVTLRAKDTLPAYTLRRFTLSYIDAKGRSCSLPLPTLRPGNSCEIPISNINSNYHFQVLRPTGEAVTEY